MWWSRQTGLSIDLRLRIINFYKCGNSYSSISNWLDIATSRVQSVIKKKFKQFCMTEYFPGHERKPKLSPRTAQKLCHEVNIDPIVVLKDVAKSLDGMGISASTHTIQHYLNRNSLYGKQPQRTPCHKPYHIVASFNLAKTFLDKENCFWEQVLWSDETKIELFRHNDVQKIWRMKGEAFLPKNTVPTLKHGGSSMMFWGCFSSKGTEQLQ